MAFAKLSKLPAGGSYMDCVSFGRGNTPLVILPGLTVATVKSAALTLPLMYRCFSRDFRVYVLDKPQSVPEGCRIEQLAACTAQAMDALGLSGACVLGVSQGGMIAQYLALQRPELVRALVIAFSASRTADCTRRAAEGWVRLVKDGDRPGFARDMFEKMYSPKALRLYRPFMPLLARFSMPADPVRFIRLAESCLTVDCFGQLPQLGCPALVIGAGQDKVVSPAASEELAAALGAELYMYEKLGHAAYDEASADFKCRVLDFFGRYR